MSKAQSGGLAKVADHRDDLEELAQSDLPCAEIAATLLELEGAE